MKRFRCETDCACTRSRHHRFEGRDDPPDSHGEEDGKARSERRLSPLPLPHSSLHQRFRRTGPELGGARCGTTDQEDPGVPLGAAVHLALQPRRQESQGQSFKYRSRLATHSADGSAFALQSRGNHIWTVEAKKIPGRKWIFREFVRCIKGSAPAVAFIGLNWQWAPRVWDPQRSSDSIDASFMSPALPEWLSWENNVLSGLVPESAYGQNYEIEAVATFQMGDKVQQLKATTRFFVASPDETEDPAAFALLAAGGQSDFAGDYVAGDEPRHHGSREASPATSPIAPHANLYRSPSGGSTSAFDSGSQSHGGRLLPPLGSAGSSFGGSVLGTPASAFEAGFPQLNARQLHEREQQRFQAHLQQVSAQTPGSGSNGSGGDMSVDETQATIDVQAQAALHQHYSTIAMQQGVSYQGVTPDQLSFAPPPELVQNALQDAVSVDSPCEPSSTTFERIGVTDPLDASLSTKSPLSIRQCLLLRCRPKTTRSNCTSWASNRRSRRPTASTLPPCNRTPRFPLSLSHSAHDTPPVGVTTLPCPPFPCPPTHIC